MAEMAVELVVGGLISLLSGEAALLRGVHKQVNGINLELQSIQALLNDADQRAGIARDRSGVRLWVEELREVAEKIEDAMDEYIQDIADRRENQQEQNSLRRRFVCFLRKVSCFIVKLKPCHEIASKIRDLKEKVQDINRRAKEYNFVPLDQTNPPTKSWADPREQANFLKETEVVGIQSCKMDLVARLEAPFPEHCVIALVGMAGIGKTTLANQVFEEAKQKFDCHATVIVSESYDRLELLRTLIKRFHESKKESAPQDIDKETDELELLKKMRGYLQGNSYLVMFDDVWAIHFWEHFKNGLPEDIGKRGKILLTTRNIEVANSCNMSSLVHIHDMKFLTSESSLELFYSKAFHREDEKACPSNFVDLSREIVERCEGLPLAIVVLGGLVATYDKNIEKWRELLTRLSSELQSNERLKSINKILSLSYNNLPCNLKSCFLYLGIFPEDYSIRSHRLVRQWIAEGLVKRAPGKTLEDVAKQHLAELINRSMVQVSWIDNKGGVRDCGIHDLVREFILANMKDLNICKVVSKGDSCHFKSLAARRVSFFSGSAGDIPKTSRIRSVFSFDNEENLNGLVSTIVLNLKLVRVLDFEDCQGLDVLDDDIGNLFHLRYLSVRGTKVKSVPRSIGKLENLETLDLKRSLVSELPVEMNKLGKLRHLLAYQENEPGESSFNSRRGVKIQKGFGNLKALQKLYTVEANVEGVDVIEEVSKLRELRKLGIGNLRSEDGRLLCACIEGLKCLESLELYSISEDEVIECNSVSSPPPLIVGLALHGRLREFPEWIGKLENLARIVLRWSKLEEDPLKSLGHLPNLLTIHIYDACYGEKVGIEKGAFPKLKELYLGNLGRLNSVIIEEGALPNLETLSIASCPQLKEFSIEQGALPNLETLLIEPCPKEFSIQEGALPNLETLLIGPCSQLKEVPYGLRHLSNLKELTFYEMPLHFVLFNDFQSLEFVPDVEFWFTTLNGYTKFCDLKYALEIQEAVKEHKGVDWNSMTSYEEMFRTLGRIWECQSISDGEFETQK